MVWTISVRIKRMPQSKKKNKRATIYIDTLTLKEAKTRRINLAMIWIDYKKAYDMVSQMRIINCLKMYKLINFIINPIYSTRPLGQDMTQGQFLIGV